MKRLLSLAASALALTAAPAAAQDIAITGATVATGDGSDPIDNATVVVRDGRVVAAGSGVTVPAGVTVLDGSGMWVTPGIFASITNLGLVDVDAVADSNDVNASNSPFGAALDVSPVINPNAQDFAYSRAGGVTRASVTPGAGASIFAGQGAIVDLGADYDAVRHPRAFQFVEMGERGAWLCRRQPHLRPCPAAQRADARQARFGDAAQLTSGRQTRGNRPGETIGLDSRFAPDADRASDVLLTRFDAAALVPVVRGEQKLYVVVERASDILSAARSARKNFLRSTWCWSALAKAGWSPTDRCRGRSGDRRCPARPACHLRAARRDAKQCRAAWWMPASPSPSAAMTAAETIRATCRNRRATWSR